MAPAPDPPTLGDLEELVLLAVLRLGSGAYGAALRRELEERAGRSVSVSSIYVTLVRLEEKGLVRSRLGEPTAVRGGKAKRIFTLTPVGVGALEARRSTRERMWQGLEGALEAVRREGG
jgi:DNA-binding PadR family transcriptional regulator